MRQSAPQESASTAGPTKTSVTSGEIWHIQPEKTDLTDIGDP
jgi:hypothetical protein